MVNFFSGCIFPDLIEMFFADWALLSPSSSGDSLGTVPEKDLISIFICAPFFND
jgi:hypothetical protein